jgi:uncharacterized membrane protein
MATQKTGFWQGFGTGLLLGGATGALLTLSRPTEALTRNRIRRIERSVQIARPLEDIYELLLHPERLTGLLPELEIVRRQDHYQYWQVRRNGHRISWEIEITQVLPLQAIGWKSRTGPLHTGRVTLAPVGHDVQVHVVMNYAPQLFRRSMPQFRAGWRAGLLAESLNDHAGRLVDDLLAHFKQALEGKGFDSAGTGVRQPPTAVAPPGYPRTSEPRTA